MHFIKLSGYLAASVQIKPVEHGLRVNAGVVCWQLTLCDPDLSALEVRFSRRCAIQIDVHRYAIAA